MDTVRKGEYLRPAYRFLKRHNLFLGSRKQKSLLNTIKLNIITTANRFFPKRFKRWLKKVFKIKTYSDYLNEKTK